VAAVRLVDPLDETELLELFQGAVDGDQAKAGGEPAGGNKDFGRVEGEDILGNGFHDSAS
jgi:hypothetical protein